MISVTVACVVSPLGVGGDVGASLAVVRTSSFELAFVGDGAVCRGRLDECWDVRFELAAPARPFPSFKKQRNWPGLWWSSTMDRHVGYESWLERDVAMMLDFDAEVVGFASQPFWLCWPDGARQRRHAPDFFARLCDGTGVVVDARADDRIGDRDAQAFAATERACREVGWQYRRTGGPDGVLAANVRWLAGYRHRRCWRPEVVNRLVEVFAEPVGLFTGAATVGDRLVVLPVLFHLMWRRLLVADLAGAPLSPHSVVRTAAGV
jgi:hypothetical protein